MVWFEVELGGNLESQTIRILFADFQVSRMLSELEVDCIGLNLAH